MSFDLPTYLATRPGAPPGRRRASQRALGRLMTAIFVLLAFSTLASAATYTVENAGTPSRGGCGVADGSDRFSRTSDGLVGAGVDANVVRPSSFCRVTASASAGPGALGASTGLRGEGLTSTGYFTTAEAVMDGFVITSDTLPDGQTISSRLLLNIDGELDTLIDGGQAIANATVRLTLSGAGTGFSDSWEWSANAFPGNPDEEFVLGGLASRIFNVRIGETFQVTLRLTTDVLLVGSSAQGYAEAGFGNTVNFNTDGDVFELPEGATVNAASANIVDNRYTVIPEPTTAMLLLLGLAGLRVSAGRAAA